MTRLLRPPIPIRIKVQVAERQLGAITNGGLETARMLGNGMSATYRLRVLLGQLKRHIGEHLHLDHNPALGARQKTFNRDGEHIGYIPAANDPDHLLYRDKRAHHIKTNVRGDGAQHPDRVLIKKNRRLEQREAAGNKNRPKKAKKFQWHKGRKLQSRGFRKREKEHGRTRPIR